MTNLERLFERYRRHGDTVALGQIFDETATEIAHIARYLTGDSTQVEDILQQTFLSAIETAERWDRKRPLIPWLLGIAANHARMARRRMHSQQSRQLIEARSLEPGPLKLTEAAELEHELDTALDNMRQPYKEVLQLHLRQDLEAQEIAQQLERSPDTVRSQSTCH